MGLNVVTGYKQSEFEMFGLPLSSMTFATRWRTNSPMMERLWLEDDELTHDGRFWKTKGAFVSRSR